MTFLIREVGSVQLYTCRLFIALWSLSVSGLAVGSKQQLTRSVLDSWSSEQSNAQPHAARSSVVACFFTFGR